ncbi:hypothetical protein BHE74_00012926 [Ensete ventricosum]|nr:hypothetical protein BHE74_00012926 [Ensete ventricosum]
MRKQPLRSGVTDTSNVIKLDERRESNLEVELRWVLLQQVQKRKEVIGIHVRVQDNPARLRFHHAGFPTKAFHQHKEQKRDAPSNSFYKRTQTEQSRSTNAHKHKLTEVKGRIGERKKEEVRVDRRRKRWLSCRCSEMPPCIDYAMRRSHEIAVGVRE